MAGKPKQPIKQDGVEHYASELQLLTKRLTVVFAAMQKGEIQELSVTGQSTADLGLTYFDGFATSCEREVRKARLNKRKA